jgi:hypothetical protein
MVILPLGTRRRGFNRGASHGDQYCAFSLQVSFGPFDKCPVPPWFDERGRYGLQGIVGLVVDFGIACPVGTGWSSSWSRSSRVRRGRGRADIHNPGRSQRGPTLRPPPVARGQSDWSDHQAVKAAKTVERSPKRCHTMMDTTPVCSCQLVGADRRRRAASMTTTRPPTARSDQGQ